uniref:Reverse transcriptase Ty1/copia-type domain-containing protein n=1 Tax=Aegilops tauschii subsp. strangulata TaxID=200361 RepID=A0A453R1Z8_AEGTS
YDRPNTTPAVVFTPPGPPPSPSSAASNSSDPSPPVVVHRPPSPSNTHTMVTRAKRGLFQPVDRLNLHVSHSTPSPIPKTYRGALHDPHWRRAMNEECDALVANRMWSLVPRPPCAHVVSGKWIFKHKFHSDGSLARYKARWVVRGYSQQPGIDFDETFSHVVKPATIRIVLSLAVS